MARYNSQMLSDWSQILQGKFGQSPSYSELNLYNGSNMDNVLKHVLGRYFYDKYGDDKYERVMEDYIRTTLMPQWSQFQQNYGVPGGGGGGAGGGGNLPVPGAGGGGGGGGAPGFPMPSGAGPQTPQDWQYQYDPLAPTRAIANIIQQMGLPQTGPMAEFLPQYALTGYYQALGREGGFDPQQLRNMLAARLQGEGAPGTNVDAVNSITNLETLLNQFIEAQPGGQSAEALKESLSKAYGGEQAGRMAYLMNAQGDPQQMANIYASNLGGKNLPPSVISLMSQLFQRILRPYINTTSSTQRHAGFDYLNQFVQGV